MELTETYHLALSLGLGLLVGFQREWAAKPLAGIRTFPLVALLGTLSAQLAAAFGGWVLAAGFLALAAIVWSGTQRTPETGITTEIALLVMFVVGATVAQGQHLAAVAVSGAVAVLLHWKQPLHEFVRRVGQDEARSVMQLVLVGLVILPALPDRSFGPYQVLNPFQIGSMVVLIVGLSLVAYVAQRLAGAIEIAWRLVLIGVLANLAFKGVAAIVLGHSRIRRWVGTLFGTAILLGAGLLLFWPFSSH